MTFVYATPFDFKSSRVLGLKVLPFEKGLFAGSGSITSAPILARKPFNNLVGSLNAQIPANAWVRMEAQALINGSWSPWFGLFIWQGVAGGMSLGSQANAWGHVDVDTLKLKKLAAAFRYRIVMKGKDRKIPVLTRAAVAVINDRKAPAAIKSFQRGPWIKEIKLRPRSQIEEQKKYCHRIDQDEPVLCSPTSLSMVLEHWGRRKETAAVAEWTRDRRTLLFGNWPLNVQSAAAFGLSGHVARLESLEDLQPEIAKGRPVVASVTIRKGDLRDQPKRETAGHLLVVAGFTASGDIIAYDPYAARRSGVRRIYPRREFQTIWLERKFGLSYILGPRFPQEMSSAAAVADLRWNTREPRRFNPADPNRMSQLTKDQGIRAVGAKGDWVRVEAVDQPYWNGKAWQGYPSWIRADSLTWAGPIGQVHSTIGPNMKRILQSAERFLGAPYVWGGLSTKGMDCSGLVYLSFAIAGLKVPRDAKDQHRSAAAVRRARLLPGDLVFLSKPKPEIYHVMLYLGGESLIESRENAGVLKTTFQERFGIPLSRIEAGDYVKNLPGRKPPQVRISFGRFRTTP